MQSLPVRIRYLGDVTKGVLPGYESLILHICISIQSYSQVTQDSQLVFNLRTQKNGPPVCSVNAALKDTILKYKKYGDSFLVIKLLAFL